MSKKKVLTSFARLIFSKHVLCKIILAVYKMLYFVVQECKIHRFNVVVCR